MDDHADATLDELAGLFLTPPAAPKAGSAAPRQDDPLAGPAPIKLSPKVAANPPAPSPPDAQLLDLLTTAAPVGQSPAVPAPPAAPPLRWTGHDEIDLTNPPRRPAPAQAEIQSVFLGNLPGMAGPWLTQYAQHLAQRRGGQHAVALLHLDGDEIDLELVEPTVRRPDDDPATREPGLRVPPGGYTDRDLVDLLDQLCRTGPTPVGTLLLHAVAPHAPDPRLTTVNHWTLLTGTDHAALAAATQLIRQQLSQAPSVASVRLNLMALGSDAPDSQQACQHLTRELGDQLSSPPRLVGHQQHMAPARCRPLGRFEGLDAQWPRLAAWMGSLRAPAAAATPPAAAPHQPEPQSPASAPPAAATAAAAARPALPPLNEPVQVTATTHDGPSDEQPNLFELIDTDPRTTASIPGGIALEARCPSAPEAQLALDAAGRLHLLLRHDSATGDLPTPREAIVELVAVRTWARQHRQLLQLTERSRRLDPDADPVLHLFTDRADLSVQLTARLGGLLKLHLLRNVAVGDQHTWFCVPLSA